MSLRRSQPLSSAPPGGTGRDRHRHDTEPPPVRAIQGLADLSTGFAILVGCIIVWVLFVLGSWLVQVVKPFTMIIIGKLMDILIGAIGIAFLITGMVATFGIPLPT